MRKLEDYQLDLELLHIFAGRQPDLHGAVVAYEEALEELEIVVESERYKKVKAAEEAAWAAWKRSQRLASACRGLSKLAWQRASQWEAHQSRIYRIARRALDELSGLAAARSRVMHTRDCVCELIEYDPELYLAVTGSQLM